MEGMGSSTTSGGRLRTRDALPRDASLYVFAQTVTVLCLSASMVYPRIDTWLIR